MNKTAIKNFAMWARNKLIADIKYKAGLLGINEKGVKPPLPQSTGDMQFYDIGTKEPYAVTGTEIAQRGKLKELIESKATQSDYVTAFNAIVEEVAYTWFNRLIAVRFMEVNDYLPGRIRVLSSESAAKTEPDLVTTPFESDLEFTTEEKERILQMTRNNKLDELFRVLFIKQCNALNAILPELFEKTDDYTELLLNISFTDKDGVVYRLTHDIVEEDFDVSKEGQVEIIGWMYQYYNTEPKDETFALLKKNVKITKERIPAATQLFTPDWIVRYMVENSLGRLWINHLESSFGYTYESNVPLRTESGERTVDALKQNWKYYLEEAPQEPEVELQIEKILDSYRDMVPEDIKVIDPCMGSGHILVYAFEVLMQIYESAGYSQRDAAKSILEHNLYGVDIDKRAYQIAYFAVMMKARQYDRRILTKCVELNLAYTSVNFDIKMAGKYDSHMIYDYFRNSENAELLGSLIKAENADFDGMIAYVQSYDYYKFDIEHRSNIDEKKHDIVQKLKLYKILAQKYDVVCTNPPYMGSSGMDVQLSEFVKKNYPDSKSDLFAVFIEKCGELTKSNGYYAMITQHAWMFLSSFEKLREKLMLKTTVNMAHLGARAFDEIGGEVVQTTAFININSKIHDYSSTYVRLTDIIGEDEKKSAFLSGDNHYVCKSENFSKIPGSPIAYWASDILLNSFLSGKKFAGKTKKGVLTGNNEKFLRLWFEPAIDKIGFGLHSQKEMIESRKKWFPVTSGGEKRKWYGNFDTIVNLENEGLEIRTTVTNYRLRDSQYYMLPAITWTEVSSGMFTCRYVPAGILFGNGGPVSFFFNEHLQYHLGLLNSNTTMAIMNYLAPTINYGPEQISKIPVKYSTDNIVNELVTNNIDISKYDWDSFETSWDFKTHPLIAFRHNEEINQDNLLYADDLQNGSVIVDYRKQEAPISLAYDAWERFTDKQFNQLKANEEELNRIFINIYGLQDELTPDVEDKDVTIRKADLGRDIRSFISYAVGCMFGRYSLYRDGLFYAGGHWDSGSKIDLTYDLAERQGVEHPLSDAFIPDYDNILPITDEEYFEDDIVGRFTEFVKVVYGEETLEQNLDFIADALGSKGNTSRDVIRNYFLKDFFKDHCKIYQKRPIYWLFDSGKENGFKALIYMHRYNEDTIGNLRIDYLHRMQRVYESEIARMQDIIDNSENAREVTAAEKRKEKLTKQLKETKDYDEKIAHLALARIAIDLDDGVKVNYEKVQTGTDGEKLEVLGKI